MTERERLIKLLEQCSCHYSPPCTGECCDCHNVEMFDRQIEHIADHLLANGVIVPPCKVGDTVYEIEKMCLSCLHFTDGGYSDYCECTLDDNKLMFECDFDKECIYDIYPKRFTYGMIELFGKTVFLTREEAEKALKEREGET